MGKSNRGQYGSSKASKPKKIHGKREKTAVSPREASFHPSDIDFKAPPKDLNEEQAEVDVATTLALVLACAARIDAGELSLPLAEDVAGVVVFFFLNYDVLTKKAGNGFTNMLNNCVQWATSGLWIALGVPVAIVGVITRNVLVIDVHPLKMRSRDKKGARINVGKEYVRRCHGLKNAIELSMLYRDYIVALLRLNAIKRGKAASVVSFGVSATSFVVKHLTGLEFTDVLGIFMHPESFLAITGDVAKKAEKGKLICVATTRAVYVAADAAARAVLILFGVTDFVSDFHVQVFEGCADLLAILSEERSKRGKAWWAGLSPAEKQGYSDRGRAAWDALPETEQLRRVTLMHDGYDVWWNALSPEDHAAHCSAIRDGFKKMSEEAKAKMVRFKGKKHTAASKKKMSKALQGQAKHTAESKAKIAAFQSAAKVGNDWNVREDTVHFYCPNPLCEGGAKKTRYKNAKPGVAFPKHFAKCSPCADVVRQALDEDDPDDVLFGYRAKWPKWLPPQN